MGFAWAYSQLPWESRGVWVFKGTGFQFLVRRINIADFVNQPLSVHGEDSLPLMFWMLRVAESLFDSVISGWHEGEGIFFLPEENCESFSCFQMAEGSLGQIPCFCKRQKCHWNRWKASFHISKQVLSYTLSSFFCLLGIFIVPVYVTEVKGHSPSEQNGKVPLKVDVTMEYTLFRDSSATESSVMAIKCLIWQISWGSWVPVWVDRL